MADNEPYELQREARSTLAIMPPQREQVDDEPLQTRQEPEAGPQFKSTTKTRTLVGASIAQLPIWGRFVIAL